MLLPSLSHPHTGNYLYLHPKQPLWTFYWGLHCSPLMASHCLWFFPGLLLTLRPTAPISLPRLPCLFASILPLLTLTPSATACSICATSHFPLSCRQQESRESCLSTSLLSACSPRIGRKPSEALSYQPPEFYHPAVPSPKFSPARFQSQINCLASSPSLFLYHRSPKYLSQPKVCKRTPYARYIL